MGRPGGRLLLLRPIRNITRIRDEAADTYFSSNTIVEPLKDYTYDAIYRLTRAEGREQISNATYCSEDDYNDGLGSGTANSNALQSYTRTYDYDGAGNVFSESHVAGSGSFTRTFGYVSGTNRLNGTSVNGGSPYSYTYDASGNMTSMPHLSAMAWNANSELSMVVAGTVNGYYQYSGGNRIRKVVEKSGGTEERIYLGSYERYRKYDTTGTKVVERDTVHVADDTGRIAMLELRTEGTDSDDNGNEPSLTRFIYSNHLQSSNLELNESGGIISYEEYHPYGTTAYQTKSSTINATAKRYRYTGKERDEESGLNYHGARYYAPWLCRWCAVDPNESKYAGWSSYNYCTCNPIMNTDSTGKGLDGDNTKSILPNKTEKGVEYESYRDHMVKTIDRKGNATTTVTGSWAPVSEHHEFEGTEVEEIKYPTKYLVNDGNLKNIANYLPTKIHDFIPAQKKTGPEGNTSVGVTGIDLLNYGNEGTSAFFFSGLRGLRNNLLKAEVRAKGEATYDRQIFISDERGSGIESIQAPAFNAPMSQIIADADMFTLAGSSSPAAIFAKGSAMKPSLLSKVTDLIGEAPGSPNEIINGCEAMAKKLQKTMGGEFLEITPQKGYQWLGNVEYAGKVAPSWQQHAAVIKDGMVYDKLTGAAGMLFTDYMAMFKDNPIFSITQKLTLKY